MRKSSNFSLDIYPDCYEHHKGKIKKKYYTTPPPSYQTD